MAKDKAGINAPLTRFQAVAYSDQAEQRLVLLMSYSMAVHFWNVTVWLRKPDRLASQYAHTLFDYLLLEI